MTELESTSVLGDEGGSLGLLERSRVQPERGQRLQDRVQVARLACGSHEESPPGRLGKQLDVSGEDAVHARGGKELLVERLRSGELKVAEHFGNLDERERAPCGEADDVLRYLGRDRRTHAAREQLDGRLVVEARGP